MKRWILIALPLLLSACLAQEVSRSLVEGAVREAIQGDASAPTPAPDEDEPPLEKEEVGAPTPTVPAGASTPVGGPLAGPATVSPKEDTAYIEPNLSGAAPPDSTAPPTSTTPLIQDESPPLRAIDEKRTEPPAERRPVPKAPGGRPKPNERP